MCVCWLEWGYIVHLLNKKKLVICCVHLESGFMRACMQINEATATIVRTYE